jgi:uncharacterized damage-inducible protein DinB
MKTHILSTLENSQNYTLAVAEALPENLYNFKPSHEGWSFNELMNHVAYGIQWWEANYVRKEETKWDPPAPKTNKRETIQYIQRCYAALQDTIEKEKLSDEIVKGFWATTDHITHHRGQAVLFLRMKGITAPEYFF